MSNSLQVLPNCHPGVAQQFEAGRPILVVARNSSGGSNKGRRDAALDAVLAIQDLANRGILDARSIVPDEATIADELWRSTDREQWVTGDSWTYFQWSSPDKSLLLLVGVGSGAKTDERVNQPFMERVLNVLLAIQPCLVFVKEIDRLGRDELGLGRIVRTIDNISVGGKECFLGSGDRGVFSRQPGWDVPFYFEGRQSRTQAEGTYRRTRKSMAQRTGRKMVHGRFNLAVSHPVPPGLARVRLATERLTAGDGIAYLDCAAFRPLSDEVIGTIPLFRTAGGQTADQVENVRWALAQYARRAPSVDVAAELALRGFSSDGLRRIHGQRATLASVYQVITTEVAGKVRSSMLRHLDFYSTGCWVINIGDSAFNVEGIIPPGGWIDGPSLASLRRQLAQSHTRVNQRQRSLLGGLKLSVGERQAVLSLYSATCVCTEVGNHDE